MRHVTVHVIPIKYQRDLCKKKLKMACRIVDRSCSHLTWISIKQLSEILPCVDILGLEREALDDSRSLTSIK